MTDRSEIFKKLVEILESDTEVKVDALDEGIAIRDGLGLDSVDLVGVIMRVEEAYRIRMTHQELEKVSLVKDLIDLIVAKTDAARAQAA